MRIFIFLIFFSGLIFTFDREAHSFSKTPLRGDTLTATDSILQFWLKKQGVDDAKPIANTFYFWTSPEELDSVDQQHLLLRSQDNNAYTANFYRYYREQLSNQKWDANRIAINLREGKFGRTRSAWPCYWSENAFDTLFYKSTQLVKVELEDSALIVVFHPKQKKAWQVFDLKGRMLDGAEIEKRSHQIAAVYFSDHIRESMSIEVQIPRKVMDYSQRTFFLCNENMIKAWHHAVPGMQKQILDDLNYLLLLDAYFASDVKKTLVPGKNGKNVIATWAGNTSEFSVAHYFFRTQTFADSQKPEAFPFAIDQIIGTLRYRWPKQVHAMERFPSRGIQ